MNTVVTAEGSHPWGGQACTVEAIPVARMARWVRDTIPPMLELTGLGSNWDSYGSPAPSVRLVRAIARSLDYSEMLSIEVPRVVPMGGGGIQLEWRRANMELEIAFHPEGRVTSLLSTPSGDILRETSFTVGDYAAIRRAIRDFERHASGG